MFGGAAEDNSGRAAWRALMAGLEVSWLRVKAGLAAGAPDPDPRLTEIFAAALAPGYDMRNAYPDANEAELRLVAQLGRPALEAKGLAYVARAQRLAVPGLEDLAAAVAAARADPGDPGTTQMRETLLEVLSATHARFADRRSNRKARNDIATRLSWAAVVVVLIPLLAVAAAFLWQGGAMTFFEIAGKYSLMSMIYSGAVGAIFSRLWAFQSHAGELTYEDLHRNYRKWLIFLRVFIGGIAAFVVYYLIASGIIAGELFPQVENGSFGTLWTSGMVQDSTQRYTMPMPNFAKLVIWCFVAGFSERFIPDRLGQVETSGGNSVQAN